MISLDADRVATARREAEHKACFTRHAAAVRRVDGAQSPAQEGNRPGSQQSSRPMRSLFGSKPKTLRECSEQSPAPAQQARVQRAGDIFHNKTRVLSRATVPTSASQFPSPVRCVLQPRGGVMVGMATQQYMGEGKTLKEKEQERARGREKEEAPFLGGFREAWKEVGGDSEEGSSDHEESDGAVVSNLMQGVLLRSPAERYPQDPHAADDRDSELSLKERSARGQSDRGLEFALTPARGERRAGELGARGRMCEEVSRCERMLQDNCRKNFAEQQIHQEEIFFDVSPRFGMGGNGNVPSSHMAAHDLTRNLSTGASVARSAQRDRAWGALKRQSIKGAISDKEPAAPSEALALAMHKLHRLHVENAALKKQVQSTRESTETAAENKGEFEAIQSLMRRQLEEREQAVTELQTTVAELRSHLRLVQRESDGWQARSQALVDEKERLLAKLEEGGHPVLDHMEQVVGKLREDFNGKVRELLDVQNQMMQQQIELRHRDERIKQLEGEVEARDNTIASLRDYVVDAGDFLARDKPFM